MTLDQALLDLQTAENHLMWATEPDEIALACAEREVAWQRLRMVVNDAKKEAGKDGE